MAPSSMPLVLVRMPNKMRVRGMNRVETAAFSKRFYRHQQLISCSLIALGVGKRNRTFPKLRHGYIGIRSHS